MNANLFNFLLLDCIVLVVENEMNIFEHNNNKKEEERERMKI